MEINQQLKVPLGVFIGKFLARLEQSPNLNKSVAMTLPRMSFEFTGLTYDPTRKVTTTQQITVKDPDTETTTKKVFMPVPYNMQFELNIMCKLNDDALQIVEQILPFFQPSYNLTVNLVSEINEKRDIPVVLENVSFQDEYEGDLHQEEFYITLRFTAKTYLFGFDFLCNYRYYQRCICSLPCRWCERAQREMLHTLSNQERSRIIQVMWSLIFSRILMQHEYLQLMTPLMLRMNSIVIDNEEMLVKSISASTSKITVQRGKRFYTCEITCQRNRH